MSGISASVILNCKNTNVDNNLQYVNSALGTIVSSFLKDNWNKYYDNVIWPQVIFKLQKSLVSPYLQSWTVIPVCLDTMFIS